MISAMGSSPAVGIASRAPELVGQTVVVIGGSAGIGLGRFFSSLPGQIDHVLVTGPGPYDAPLGGQQLVRTD